MELALGAAGCTNGTEIESQELCQGALASLGLTHSTSSWTDRADVPRSCSHGDNFDTHMHWSTVSAGGNHPDLAPVCRETPIRYIKLQSNLPENWAAWREIEVYASNQEGISQNVALSGTAMASNTCGQENCTGGDGLDDFSPMKAIDGNVSTLWNSGGAPPAWIEIDLGNEYYIDRVRAVFGPQLWCVRIADEGQDVNGNGCEAYRAGDAAMCTNETLFNNTDFDAARDCCACGGGDRARVGVDGIHDSSQRSPAHSLQMAGSNREYMEFEMWMPKPADSVDVEYVAPRSARPHRLFTCAPLENDIDYVGYEFRGRDDDDNYGGRVENVEDCCALCQSEYAAGCRFWSWDGDNRCYLKNGNATAGRTTSVGMTSGAVAQAVREAPLVLEQCGEMQVGIDIEGFDIAGHVYGESAEHCCMLCQDAYADGCRYWTFHDDHCHLKSSNVTIREREGRTSGSIVSQALLDRAELLTCAAIEEGIEYHGGEALPDIKVASAEECCDQCQGAHALGCRFWTYKIGDGKCQRKTGQGERRSRNDRISGSVGPVLASSSNSDLGAGGVTVRVLGRSGKFRVFSSAAGEDNARAVTIEMDSLQELDANGEPVGASGQERHSINTFANQDFTLSPVESNFMMGVGMSVAANKLSFQSPIGEVGNISVDTFVISSPGLVGPVGEEWDVGIGDMKFNIRFPNWKWCGDDGANCRIGEVGEFLELKIKMKGAASEANLINGTLNTYDLGGGANMSLTDKVMLDGVQSQMPAAFPSLHMQGNSQIFSFRFPKFTTSAEYDPVLSQSWVEEEIQQVEEEAAAAAAAAESQRELAAGAVTVKCLGHSGKLRMFSTDAGESDANAITIEMDSLRELDVNGEAVGDFGRSRHSINTFANQDFMFSPVESDFMMGVNMSVAANKLSLQSSINDVGNISLDTFVMMSAGRVGPEGEEWPVNIGDMKFNIRFPNWRWCGDDGSDCDGEVGEYLELNIKIKGAASEATLDPRTRNYYNLGGSANLTLTETVVIDGVQVQMPEGYPSLRMQGNSQIFSFRFPKFATSAEYDPLVSHGWASDFQWNGIDSSLLDGAPRASSIFAILLGLACSALSF